MFRGKIINPPFENKIDNTVTLWAVKFRGGFPVSDSDVIRQNEKLLLILPGLTWHAAAVIQLNTIYIAPIHNILHLKAL